MYSIKNAKLLCLERDARRCRHCGTTDNLSVLQLVPREGVLAWHLSNLITLCSLCSKRADRVRNNPVSNRVGVVLCGGRGTRLYPVTLFMNKHELPIGIIPMIFSPIKTLQALGVNKVMIILDREGAGTIAKMLGSGNEFGMDFAYKVQEGAGGISEALYLAKDFAKHADEIVCILGDNIFDNNSLDLDIRLNDSKACVWLKEVDNPKAYGIANIEKGKVKCIVEKPTNPDSNLAVVGLYMYDNSVFDIIEKIKPSDRGELEISAVNDYYASKNQLKYRMVKGYWADCGGSIQRYCEASLHGAKQAKVSREEISEFISVVFDDK